MKRGKKKYFVGYHNDHRTIWGSIDSDHHWLNALTFCQAKRMVKKMEEGAVIFKLSEVQNDGE